MADRTNHKFTSGLHSRFSPKTIELLVTAHMSQVVALAATTGRYVSDYVGNQTNRYIYAWTHRPHWI
jgi:hypothetical protein